MQHTYYASPERTADVALTMEIQSVSENPVVSGLLRTISGLLAVVDEHRQIVALNDSFLKLLGIADPAEALGLRPGEALQCIHAHDDPAGCGTTRYCSTCGAAIAMVTSFEQDIPTERLCALTTQRNSKAMDMALLVRSHPMVISGHRFLLLFVQDITLQQHRAALERTFFHDITNMVSGIIMACQMLEEERPSELTELVSITASRLHKEIEIQRCLSTGGRSRYQPNWDTYPVDRVFLELKRFFAHHPAVRERQLTFSVEDPHEAISTDVSALSRVLSNMIINALEASEAGGTVRVWVEREEDAMIFRVWNAQSIPEDVGARIFQRNFSTKDQDGRGIGTFSMKLFGEKILGGQVGFSSSEEDGTVFWLKHPV